MRGEVGLEGVEGVEVGGEGGGGRGVVDYGVRETGVGG